MLGSVECGEQEHENLGAHTYGEQRITASEVQDFEQCTQDDDCGAYTVGEVEETLPFFSREHTLDKILISLDFSHCC